MASEVERIGDECRRYSERMVERMAESRARREARSRELAEQSAAERQRFGQELAERAAEQEGPERDRPVGEDEKGRPGTERPAPAERQPGPESFRLRETEIQRLRDEAMRRQQEAVAPPVEGGVPVQRTREIVSSTPSAPVGELDPREAIARSAAARRRNNVVAPVDDDGDDEAEYYRRNSWLV